MLQLYVKKRQDLKKNKKGEKKKRAPDIPQ